MTAGSDAAGHRTTEIVPRCEWSSFGGRLGTAESLLAELAAAGRRERHTAHHDASVSPTLGGTVIGRSPAR